METKTVNPERAWAEGMEQDEFEVAYRRKYGAVDTIPYVGEWLYKESPNYHGISPMNPNDLVDDKMASEEVKIREKMADDKKKEESGECICKGCGKVAKSMFGLKSHQRHCKALKD